MSYRIIGLVTSSVGPRFCGVSSLSYHLIASGCEAGIIPSVESVKKSLPSDMFDMFLTALCGSVFCLLLFPK